MSPTTQNYVVGNLKKFTKYEFFVAPFYRSVEGQPSNSKIVQTFEDGKYKIKKNKKKNTTKFRFKLNEICLCWSVQFHRLHPTTFKRACLIWPQDGYVSCHCCTHTPNNNAYTFKWPANICMCVSVLLGSMVTASATTSQRTSSWIQNSGLLQFSHVYISYLTKRKTKYTNTNWHGLVRWFYCMRARRFHSKEKQIMSILIWFWIHL